MPYKSAKKRKDYLARYFSEHKKEKRLYDKTRYQSNQAVYLAYQDTYRSQNKNKLRQYYQINKKQLTLHMKKYRQQKRKALNLVKKLIGCSICGVRHYLVFHHRSPKDKKLAISTMMTHSWKQILLEIDKCNIVCHACHKKIHFKTGS